MKFPKKEGKGIIFGEFDPILYSDQEGLIETYQKSEEDFRKGKKEKRLTREERLNLYMISERQRIVKEKNKANKCYIGMGLAFIVLFITSVPVYIYIPDYSFFIINCLFVIDISFTIYLYSKQYNVYDKLRERDMYLTILDIKKKLMI